MVGNTKIKNGIAWELDGTKEDFCAFIVGGDGYVILTIHYTHKQLIDMRVRGSN